MTTGIQTQKNSRYDSYLLLDTQGTNGKPAEGAAATVLKAAPAPTEFLDLRGITPAGRKLPTCALLLHNVAGTGVVSISYVRVWLYNATTGKSYPYGVGADADKGKINGGAALGVTDTDKLRHFEILPDLGFADGIQVELGVTTGTGTETFTAYLLVPRDAGD